MIIHVVAASETLQQIATFYGVPIDTIISINRLTAPYILPVGATLVIQIPNVMHTVVQGESLYTIAQQYGVTVREILRNNPHLRINDPLSPGTTVIISYQGEKTLTLATNAYAYTYINPELLSQVLPFLTRLIPFTYGMTSDGTLIPFDDTWMIAASRQYAVAPVMHLSTLTAADIFDSSLAENILQNPGLQTVLIQNIIRNLEEKGYTGLDIDFEYIPPQYGTAYYQFILTLRDTLNPLGYEVITALAPKTSDTQPGLLYEAHNYSLIGQASNYVFLMTYEWGYSAGPPMAVAPINQVRRVLDYALSVIPREKIYLGIPLYGYDWTLPYSQTRTAPSISPDDAVALALRYGSIIQYSEYAQAPYFYYTDENGTQHEVWFEDARSIRAKLELVREYGLPGVGYWQAGRRFAQNWAVLNAMCNIITL